MNGKSGYIVLHKIPPYEAKKGLEWHRKLRFCRAQKARAGKFEVFQEKYNRICKSESTNHQSDLLEPIYTTPFLQQKLTLLLGLWTCAEQTYFCKLVGKQRTPMIVEGPIKVYFTSKMFNFSALAR